MKVVSTKTVGRLLASRAFSLAQLGRGSTEGALVAGLLLDLQICVQGFGLSLKG